MAQDRISLNLSSADFVLSYRFKGPSVIIPGRDQNAYAAQQWWAGEMNQRGTNIPQLAYCENTVPTSEGYRSVAFRYFIDPPSPAQTFVKILTIFDGYGNSALVGVTHDRKLFIVSAYTGGLWEELDLPVGLTWTTYAGITNTVVNGNIVICIAGVGFVILTVSTSSLANANPFVLGIDPTLMRGICSTKGYLIAYDATTVYWSSTENALDFVPSLITGAGSATPEGIKGSIVLCKEISQGFIIYCDATIISAAYSSNKAIPWIFEVLSGGSGIRHEDAVAYDVNMTTHFAWTSAGLIAIELHTAKPIFPQVTDFIASGLSDETTSFDSAPTTTFDDRDKEVRLAVVSSRYLLISFGYLTAPLVEGNAAIPDMLQTFLYDMQLKRWGKLNIASVQMVEMPFNSTVAEGGTGGSFF